MEHIAELGCDITNWHNKTEIWGFGHSFLVYCISFIFIIETEMHPKRKKEENMIIDNLKSKYNLQAGHL